MNIAKSRSLKTDMTHKNNYINIFDQSFQDALLK